jgi:uncharacterized protein (TIGR00297 family)
MTTGKRSEAKSELLRKVVHIGFGLMALALRWLSYPLALAMAAAAFLFNWLILPRFGGRQIARSARGNDVGILLYPAIVFAAIALFGRREMYLAAAVWAILAFGDGFASLIGRLLRSVRLPWNEQKSLAGMMAFVFFGGIGTFLTIRFVGAPAGLLLPLPVIVAAAVIASAIAESLELGLDDNLVIGIVAASSLYWLVRWNTLPQLTFDSTTIIWLIVNALLAVTGYALRSVNVSGLLTGVVLGSMLILFGGWPLYVALLVFFVLGSGTTKLGYKRKSQLGLAQEEGGRRGASHAFANAGVAAICALSYAAIAPHSIVWLLAAIAALATAAADTTSSELGQLFGKRPFLPMTLQRVPVGTEGAISIEGTVAGAVGGVITAAAGGLALHGAGVLPGEKAMWAIALCALAAIAGSYIESVAGSINRRSEGERRSEAERNGGKKISNGALNFFNTAVGALIAALLARMAGFV